MNNNRPDEDHPIAKRIGQAIGAMILAVIAVPSVTIWTSSPEDTAILSHGYCSNMKINVISAGNDDRSKQALLIESIANDAAELGIGIDQLTTSCAELTAADSIFSMSLSGIKYSFLAAFNRSQEEKNSAGI